MVKKVLVTGITGFAGKHVALRLLQAGYGVIGTLRRLERAEEVRHALRPHLDATSLLRLCFVEADLLSDVAWAAAMAEISVVVHLAGPFVIEVPRDPQDVIRPMVDGTLRVLRAAQAAGVRRVVMASATAAVLVPAEPGLQSEGHWTDPDAPTTSVFGRAKIFAERAAWDLASRDPQMQLTVINPGLMLGPPLDRHYGASVGVVRRVLRAKDPLMPMLGLAMVDVRDVAEMFLRVIEAPQAVGRRFIGVSGSVTLPDLARILKRAHPRRRIPTMVAPHWVLQLWRLWDPEVEAILPILGYLPQLSNALARSELGVEFRPPADTVLETASWLIAAGEA